MKKIKKHEIAIFLAIMMVTYIIYTPLLTGHYATDTYNIINIGYKQYAIKNSFVDGRIFAGILEIIASKINIPINITVTTFTSIALLISCISVMILKSMIINLKKEKNKFFETITIIMSYITIFNFMYVENLYYIESLVMSVSILMYILAIREIINKRKKYQLKAIIFAIIATFSYQGTISLFLIYGFVFIIIKNKKDMRNIIKDLALVIFIALIAFIINVLQIKITTNVTGIEQDRLGGIYDILLYFKTVIICFNQMVIRDVIINSCGLFPRTLIIYFIIGVLEISIIYEIIYNKEKIILNLIEIIIATLIIATAMCSINLLGYDTGRIHNEIGALVGLMYIYLFCNSDIFIKNKIIKSSLTVILIIYMLANIINTIILLNQHKEVNKLEKELCIGLENYIEEYERENNTKVTEAKYFREPGKESAFFNNISNKLVLTHNGVMCRWSSIGTINFYTNRKFEGEFLENSKEIYEKYTQQKEEGYCKNFVIIENVLYYTIAI